MAKEKVTVTLERAKLAEAQELIGSPSLSGTIDVALDRLIRAERLRQDVAAYTAQPASDDELALADIPVELDLGDDAVDYDLVYGQA
jgi:hypothetical protein